MIIKGQPRGNGAKLARYLLHEPKNEHSELLDMRGFAADSLKAALGFEEALAASTTRCKQPLYHVSFRAAPGEALTPAQWTHCADRLEQRLGLAGHHRALVLHTYKGDTHLHAIWSRLDPETQAVAQLAFDHLKCKETARALERELGLQPVRNHKREPERELLAPTMGEEQQARRHGQDLQATRAAIRAAWERSQDGRSFADELQQRGLSLAQGDRRDFVALDEHGGTYSIGKRTTGVTAKEMRDKLHDLDRERVPTIEAARKQAGAGRRAGRLATPPSRPSWRQWQEGQTLEAA